MDNTMLKFDNFLWDYLKKDSYKIYYQFLIEKNKVMNLTNITEEKDVYEKHFYDSVILQKAIDIKNKSLLDVGSGAGFPSLPLKLYDDSLKVTIVDSLNKRILFLKELVEKLDLKNIELIHSRAEDLEVKEAYDIVAA
ncbi:MAG: 16S rRNA (guanine(527)-N(7))-methyltransferase RsmG, partial [Candidatus Izemoplasmatales bacterium]|nr:16S rRNA (guanine(527)-N(7))-methyltransferase RsmG [Candidatus Izemoplasmatales bacterium]